MRTVVRKAASDGGIRIRRAEKMHARHETIRLINERFVGIEESRRLGQGIAGLNEPLY